MDSEGNVTVLGLLFVLFTGLKLGGVISWSWWLVTFPLWGPAIVYILLAVVAAALVAVLGEHENE